MIDSHCHLAGEEFAGDLPEVISRAKGAGISRALVILSATDPAEIERARRVAQLWPEVRFAVGVHPHHANEFLGDPGGAAIAIASIIESLPGVVALGEMGLDYHYDFSPRDIQQKVFAVQLRVAREWNLPVVIHSREAEADTAKMLRGDGGGGLRGVIHCFTGTQKLADDALALGFYISLAGIVTFPRANDIRGVARRVPLDRVLVETDSPYLAPVPHRGKRNEPAYVDKVAESLATMHSLTPEAMHSQLVANFDALFGAR